jgi:hypothetical protein
MNGQETTPCKYCGKQTPMLGTKLCDPCWELERRIYTSPEIAIQILGQFDQDHEARMAEKHAAKYHICCMVCNSREVLENTRLCNLCFEFFARAEVLPEVIGNPRLTKEISSILSEKGANNKHFS